MKKPHSITEICLSILRVALCAGVAVSVIKYLVDSSRQERIIISGLPQSSQTVQITTTESLPVDTPSSTVAVSSSVTSFVPEETPPAAITESTDIVSQPDKIQPVQTSTSPVVTTIIYTADTSDASVETKPAVSSVPDGLINLNTATVSQLMGLKGIGEVKANAIVRYREENGVFHSIDEILNVKGIGEKTFEKIRNQITV